MERLGWLANFTRAVDGTIAGNHQGMMFADSDVFKLMEAMAWEVGRSGSEDADARFRHLTSVVAPAQEGDGYLNTVFGRDGQRPRYSDLEWGHELYNDGHLFQAAVARARTTGPDEFVATARRVADHVCDTFGDGGIERVGGHPEVELGLAELARVTGEQRYLDQAARFVERRGRGTLGEIQFGPAYFQDDMPIRDATIFRGHAVRALYLAAGAVDVAVETGDDELLGTLIAQWENTIARRTYLTGGMGSQHTGEAFGDDFVLPPDRAVLRDVCRDRLGDAGVAAPAGHRRVALRRSDRAHACTTSSPRHRRRTAATSSTPTRCTSRCRGPCLPRTRRASGRRRACARRGSSSRAARRTSPARSPASPPTSPPPTTAGSNSTSTPRAGSARRSTAVAWSALELSTGYPDDGTVTVKVTETDGAPWAAHAADPTMGVGSRPRRSGRPAAAGHAGHRRRRATVRRR